MKSICLGVSLISEDCFLSALWEWKEFCWFERNEDNIRRWTTCSFILTARYNIINLLPYFHICVSRKKTGIYLDILNACDLNESFFPYLDFLLGAMQVWRQHILGHFWSPNPPLPSVSPCQLPTPLLPYKVLTLPPYPNTFEVKLVPTWYLCTQMRFLYKVGKCP